MYIAINSVENGFLVEFTKYTRPPARDYWGVKVQRFYPTPASIDIQALIKEATDGR